MAQVEPFSSCLGRSIWCTRKRRLSVDNKNAVRDFKVWNTYIIIDSQVGGSNDGENFRVLMDFQPSFINVEAKSYHIAMQHLPVITMTEFIKYMYMYMQFDMTIAPYELHWQTCCYFQYWRLIQVNTVLMLYWSINQLQYTALCPDVWSQWDHVNNTADQKHFEPSHMLGQVQVLTNCEHVKKCSDCWTLLNT